MRSFLLGVLAACAAGAFLVCIRGNEWRGLSSFRGVFGTVFRCALPSPLGLLKGIFIILGVMLAFGFAGYHPAWGSLAPETTAWSSARPLQWIAGKAGITMVVLSFLVAQCNVNLDVLSAGRYERCSDAHGIMDGIEVKCRAVYSLAQVLLAFVVLFLVDGWDATNRIALAIVVVLLLWWGKAMRRSRTKAKCRWSELLQASSRVKNACEEVAPIAEIRLIVRSMNVLCGIEAVLLLLGGFVATYPFEYPDFWSWLVMFLRNGRAGLPTASMLGALLCAAFAVGMLTTRLAWTFRAVREHRSGGASEWRDYSEASIAHAAMRLGDAIDADRPLLAGLTMPVFLAVPTLVSAVIMLAVLRRYVAGEVVVALELMVLLASMGCLLDSISVILYLIIAVAVLFHRWIIFPLLFFFLGFDYTDLSPAVAVVVGYVALWALYFGARFVDVRMLGEGRMAMRLIVNRLLYWFVRTLGVDEEGARKHTGTERSGGGGA